MMMETKIKMMDVSITVPLISVGIVHNNKDKYLHAFLFVVMGMLLEIKFVMIKTIMMTMDVIVNAELSNHLSFVECF